VLGDGALDRIVSEGVTARDENLVRPEPTSTVEEPAAGPATMQPEKMAEAKLRVALATADRTSAPKPTGVHFVSGTHGHSGKQIQMIYDDGSVRNPYKAGRISGRQKRLMRKQANRNLRAQGIKTDLRLVFKGRQPAPGSPLPVTPEHRTPDPLGDALAD
jgi:hypothetical protein